MPPAAQETAPKPRSSAPAVGYMFGMALSAVIWAAGFAAAHALAH